RHRANAVSSADQPHRFERDCAGGTILVLPANPVGRVGQVGLVSPIGQAHRGRNALLASFLLLAVATATHADIILSATILNTTLKTLERLKQRAANGTESQRTDALFQTGVEADRLASLINGEIASHGMQERELIDLAVSRTKELGIAISYHREKKKFFYDGA